MSRPNILLGVTGSVAAKLTPLVYAELEQLGPVQVVATDPSFYFWRSTDVIGKVWRERDEWPGQAYEREQEIPHITLGEWADILVIAPLSANTTTKIALGLSDNMLTCLYSAWPARKPVVLAPAMNTRMWENPRTLRYMAELEIRHRVVQPIVKRLACGTTGIGAMAEPDAIRNVVRAELMRYGHVLT